MGGLGFQIMRETNVASSLRLVGDYWWRKINYGLKYYAPNTVTTAAILICLKKGQILLINGVES